MIQSGYCLIDMSWWNPTDYTQGETYTYDENALEVYKDLKGAINSGKIIFLKLGNQAMRVLTAVADNGNSIRIQTYEPAAVSQDGAITFKIAGYMFTKNGGFLWDLGGNN